MRGLQRGLDIEMAISGRKRNGAPDAKYWDANETVAKFDSVRQWLLKNCKKVNEFMASILIKAHYSIPNLSLQPTSICQLSLAPCSSFKRYFFCVSPKHFVFLAYFTMTGHLWQTRE